MTSEESNIAIQGAEKRCGRDSSDLLSACHNKDYDLKTRKSEMKDGNKVTDPRWSQTGRAEL